MGKTRREKRKKDRSEGDRDKRKKSHRHREGDEERYSVEHDIISRDSALYSASTSSGTRLFYPDKKGDVLNVKYGGLHKGDIPEYHLVASEPNL